MQTKSEYSYGIIPLHKTGDEVRVFLIHQYGATGDTFWGIPKGHIEGDETPLETAIREVFEETNLLPVVDEVERMYELDYEFMLDETLIKKHTGYYVGWVEDMTFTTQDAEIKEAGWFSFEEAKEKFSFARYQTLLQEVQKDLDI